VSEKDNVTKESLSPR